MSSIFPSTVYDYMQKTANGVSHGSVYKVSGASADLYEGGRMYAGEGFRYLMTALARARANRSR